MKNMVVRRHGSARIILSLPGWFFAALILLSWVRGEPMDTWPILVGALAWAVLMSGEALFFRDTLDAQENGGEQAPAKYLDYAAKQKIANKLGRSPIHVDQLPHGCCHPWETVQSITARTGQRNSRGEYVCITVCWDRFGSLIFHEWHIEDVSFGLIDRTGGQEI